MVGLGGRLGVTVTGVAVRVVTGTWVVGLGGCVVGLGVVVIGIGVTTVTPFGVGVGSAPTPAPTKSG